MHQPSTYTPLEIATMFGVKPSTVYAWLSRKELSANKVGHYRYITNHQLREFYAARSKSEYIDRTYQYGPI